MKPDLIKTKPRPLTYTPPHLDGLLYLQPIFLFTLPFWGHRTSLTPYPHPCPDSYLRPLLRLVVAWVETRIDLVQESSVRLLYQGDVTVLAGGPTSSL